MNVFKKLAQASTGVAILPVLLVAGVIGTVGMVGYAVYQSNQSDRQANSEASDLAQELLVPSDIQELRDLTASELEQINQGISRIGQENRFETAVEVSQIRFPDGATQVYIANGYRYPDAVIAASYANDGPLLYAPDPDDTGTNYNLLLQEVSRLQPQRVVIVGGNAVVGETLENRLKGIAGSVSRIEGETRDDTAAIAASQRPSPARIAVVVNGYEVSTTSLLHPQQTQLSNILFSNNDILPETTRGMLIQNNYAIVRIFGGEDVVPQSIIDEIQSALPNAFIQRVAGNNRFETAVEMSRITSAGRNRLLIVNADSDADALVGSTISYNGGGAVLLVNKDSVPVETADEIKRVNPDQIIIVGGTARVSEDTKTLLGAILYNHYSRPQ